MDIRVELVNKFSLIFSSTEFENYLAAVLARKIVGFSTVSKPINAIFSLFVLMLLLHAPNSQAFELGLGDWQAHGFASQGYTLTSRYQLFGESRNGGSTDFTEVGINVLGHITPNLLMAAQGLYRSAGGSDNQGGRLDFANLDYHFSLFDGLKAGIRLGRVKNPFGLYNETRDVIWTRPGVMMPQSVYFDSLALRQPMISSDGGVLYSRYANGDHAITTEFVISEPLDQAGGAPAFLTGISNAKGTMGGRPMFIGRMGYEWQEGRFKLLFSVVDLDRDFTSSVSSLPSGNIKAFYPLASAQLNLEEWSFTAEYGQISTERSGFQPGGLVQKNTSESFYVQTQYRFMPEWSALIRYDSFTANIDDRDGKRTSAALRSFGLNVPEHSLYARDLTFGLRWEFLPNWLLASEYHSVWGTAWLSADDNPNVAFRPGPERWDLFSIMLSYRF
ncbi:MAG: hypothetical protein ACU836_15895 [Gammaproteobacteria bacterium]